MKSQWLTVRPLGSAAPALPFACEKQPPIRSAIHIDFPVDFPVSGALHCPIPRKSHAGALLDKRGCQRGQRRPGRVGLSMKAILLALLFGAMAVNGQEVIETWDGSYRAFQDEQGRYVRLESSDGIVLHYLYDSPAATAETGVAVRVSETVTLTVRYNDRGDFSAPGLPNVSMVPDSHDRTLEIRAGDKPIATFAYRPDKYIAGVSLPGHLSMRLTPPDARQHVRQILQSGAGTVIGLADVVSSAAVVGMWSGFTFDTVAG